MLNISAQSLPAFRRIFYAEVTVTKFTLCHLVHIQPIMIFRGHSVSDSMGNSDRQCHSPTGWRGKNPSRRIGAT